MDSSEQPVIVCEDARLTFNLPEKTRQSIKDVFMSGGRTLRSRPLEVLRGVSFSVSQGEVLGIVGRNGAGKSTLLRVLGGIYLPDSGRVEVRGSIGMMMELGAGFHPDLSGRDNVFLNASLIGVPPYVVEARYDRIVEWAGLQDFMEMEMRHYSSGMRARLGFSVAVELRPNVLFIDEVLSVGDEEFRRKCDIKFREFIEAGTTIVLVSHSLSEIRNRCTRVLWLDEGRTREIGPPEEVLAHYKKAMAPPPEQET